MKILQISPQNVLPPTDGGKVGIYNIFKTLNKLGVQTDIAFYYDQIENIEYWNKWKNIGNLSPIQLNTENTKLRIISSFLTNQSLYLTKHINKEVLSQFENLIETNNYDVLLCDHTAMAPVGLYLKKKYNLPTFLRLHNIEYLIWERYYQELNNLNPLKLFIGQQANLLKKYEEANYNKFDHVFTINENEKEFVKQMSPFSKIETISAGVDNEMWNYKDLDFELKKENIISIATNFNWVHNINGIDWFISEVLPLIKLEIPDIKLKLYGKGLPEKYKNIKSSGIFGVGFVEDIVKELKKSKVYIAPLFVGAGIRIKILEAMGCGLPVVATKVSADGIKANENDGLFVSNDASKQAQIIIDLLQNKNKLKLLSQNSATFIYENYSWEKSISKMIEIIDITLKNHKK